MGELVGENYGDDKDPAAEQGTGGDTERERAEILDTLLKDAVDYFNRGRHIAQTGEQKGRFPVSHRDARFALTLSKVLLAEIADIISAPHN